MKIKRIPDFYEHYASCKYSLTETARVLGISFHTAKKNLIEYQKEYRNIIVQRKKEAFNAAWEQAQKLAEQGDKEIIKEIINIESRESIENAKIKSREKIAKFDYEKAKIDVSENKKQRLSQLVQTLKEGLTPYQNNFDACKTRFKGILSSTKAGKTHYCVYETIKECFINDSGSVVWWIAPTYKVAKIAYRRVMRLLNSFKVPCKANKSSFEIEFFDTGVILQFKSADNADNLYGEDVKFAVFDEFTRASETAWTAIYSTLTATKGKATLIGNFTSAQNWGVRMVKDRAAESPNEYTFFKVTAWQAVEAGILAKEIIEQAQKDLHEVVFNALYLCEGSYDELALVQLDKIKAIFTSEPKPKGKHYITADIALQGSDRFVVGVWNDFELVEIFTMAKSNGKEVAEAIIAFQKKYDVAESNIVYDADGVGGFLDGYLPFAFSFRGNRASKTYQNLRTRCYFALATAVNNGSLTILPKEFEKEITEELSVIKKAAKDYEGKLAIIGKARVRELIGRSPDFSDMLMMRYVLL